MKSEVTVIIDHSEIHCGGCIYRLIDSCNLFFESIEYDGDIAGDYFRCKKCFDNAKEIKK